MAFNVKAAIKALFQQSGTLNLSEKQAIDINNPASLALILNNGDYTSDVMFVTAAQEGFQRNVVTYRCIQMVSSAVASLHWVLKNTKTGEAIPSHPLLDLLNKPNPLQGKSTFFHHIQADKMLDGNYFIEMVKPTLNMTSTSPPDNKPPIELWVNRPDMMQVIISNRRLPESYTYTAGTMGGQTKIFPVDQLTGNSNIIHGISYSPMRETQRGRGISPVTSAWLSIQTHNEGSLWNRSLLKHGARPSLVLTTDKALTSDQVDSLSQMISENHAGGRNAAKTMIATNGLKASTISLSPVDMDFVNGKSSAARDIALALGVPPVLLCLPGDTAYNNVVEARTAFYQETVIPEACAIRDELNRRLVPLFGNNLMLDIDLDKIEALAPVRMSKWQFITDATFLTQDEKRAALGYAPLPDGAGDEILVPTNMMPMNEAVDDGEQTEPGPGEGDDDASAE